jgi:hypothetical protein
MFSVSSRVLDKCTNSCTLQGNEMQCFHDWFTGKHSYSAALGKCVPVSAIAFHNSVTKTNQLMLYREIIAVCSEIHTKHINTLYGQNVEFVS